MKKMYWMGLFATLLAWGGCSEENGLNSENNGNEPMDEQAYLTVRIMDAGANTRASDGGFEEEEIKKEDMENYVTGASFFFYDDGKSYVGEASVWDKGTADTDIPADNIEFNGNTVIVWNKVEKKGYPKYMITVLNAPANYEPGSTLDAMLATLSGGIYQGDNSKSFIMSTTSYVHDAGTAGTATPYFVTELTDDNFQEKPIPEDIEENDVVKVYVERLAAKVTLKANDQISNKEDNGLYKLNVTVAGSENADNENATAGTNIYIKLLGWGLNATAENSYMMKNINESWTSSETGLGFTWNEASKFRSYWGMSYNYNDAATDYPTTAAGAATDTDCKLNYINANAATTELGKSAYCAENTFPATIASTAPARTSILLKAQICDANGNGLDMVRYNGLLFNKSHYISYVLNALNNSDKLNAWYQIKAAEGTEPAEYAQINESHVELASRGDGKVKVQLIKKTSAGNTTVETSSQLYTRSGSGTEKDPYKFTKFTADNIKDTDEELADFDGNNPATGYTSGLMYYNIPIEHLRAISGNDLKEANYGVVRNHHYVVTINKLENVGTGIFDPEEVIVPPSDDKTSYYVGASIHILSWKIVSQNVEL